MCRAADPLVVFEWPGSTSTLAVAHGSARLEARCRDLERDLDPDPLPLDCDAVAAGRCTSLRVGGLAPALHALEDGVVPPLDGETSLGRGDYCLRLDGECHGVVRFRGPARVRASPDGASVAFPGPSRVTVGICTRRRAPAETVTVPSTPAGVATAVTHAAAAHRTTAPVRSLPGLRRHPPALAFGERDVPDAVAAETPDTGIEFVVPASYADVFTVAPRAYYLGASLTVSAQSSPRLRVPEAGVDRVLSPLAEVASAMLRRVFFLDCVVRPAARPGLAATGLRSRLGLDAPALRTASPAERLGAYLDAPFGSVDADLPPWHLATYAPPDERTARCLPALLDRRSLVYLPETEPLDGGELVARSLDDFYRGGADRLEVQKPVLRRGALHGWLAPETPIDVFDSHPAAYANRPTADASSFRVVVVRNDEEMAGEDAAAADAYRARDVPATVAVRRDLSRRDLASVLAEDVDLVHFIGHCEESGLQCADGYLAVESLDAVGARSFFLNACGSYHEGRALVRRGSVAGAVTFRDVLDGQATTVGTTFARLLVRGFCVERALDLARRRIRMGKDYAAVGDATYAPAGDHEAPVLVRVSEAGDGYEVSVEGMSDDAPGGAFSPPVGDPPSDVLRGRGHVERMDAAALGAALSGTDYPVIHDEGFAWASAFAAEL
jgi:hypothetical protein